jgi:hypothetical protein
LDLERINQAVLERAADVKPAIVWVDKGLVIRRDTLHRLRVLDPAIKLVHFNPDDPFGGFGLAGWRTFLNAIPEYDVHFVPRRQNVAEYRGCGARRVIQLVPAWGYASKVHRPVAVGASECQRFGADLGFVGSFEADRGERLFAAAEAGLNVRIVGPWPAPFLHARMRHIPEGAFGMSYATAICSFKIALGFLRKQNRDQHTSRSVEIPACGVFMLAERSTEHELLFEEGKEAEFFSSTDELIDKARYYLTHDRQRQQIAEAGRRRCIRSGYSNEECLLRMLEAVCGDSARTEPTMPKPQA